MIRPDPLTYVSITNQHFASPKDEKIFSPLNNVSDDFIIISFCLPFTFQRNKSI
jgi:hypothetical protein